MKKRVSQISELDQLKFKVVVLHDAIGKKISHLVFAADLKIIDLAA